MLYNTVQKKLEMKKQSECLAEFSCLCIKGVNTSAVILSDLFIFRLLVVQAFFHVL